MTTALLTQNNHRPGREGRDDVCAADVDVDDGVHSTYFLNVVPHSDHPVNLDKTMRGEKEGNAFSVTWQRTPCIIDE
jgi:hypothetical protein